MTTKSILFGARRTKGNLNNPGMAGIRRMPATIALVRNSIGRPRRGFLLLPVAILSAWFALSPARAVDPAPDGGYPGENTAEGTDALLSLTTGGRNTALGFRALSSNTGGPNNTATGANALRDNSIGGNNTATGVEALRHNTTGSQNTATGIAALQNNTTGFNNTATGNTALQNNTAGGDNTATGLNALRDNTTGSDNTATGLGALLSNTTGVQNTAIGRGALSSNTIGNGNTAIGSNALRLSTGTSNIALGGGAGQDLTTGDHNIYIGNRRVAGESRTIRIGATSFGASAATFIAHIRGATVASGVGVIIGTRGQLGTVVSSARFKEAIKPMDQASEAILALKPVTFRYKHALDPEGIPQFGLVAEQVEKVNPDLVARDDEGKVNTVRYEAVNAMLLNEFLKEHRKVQELEAAIARQRKDSAQHEKEIKSLAASLKALQIHKVSGRLGVIKPPPQTAAGG